ncbi:hypothetical protein [Dankookia rubra]|uniref:hypothetical protein n=1 Tax=Dankookia rubra TaxID=1442381 RepID=UPI0014088538|nr:hypothetical protein [Dankookia rubra]
MSGFGLSALMLGAMRRHKVPGLDEDIGRRDAALRRLAVLLGVQLVLFLAVTVAIR